MDHPTTRILARYALGDITDDAELTALEDHLLECEECRRRAVAVDLIGSSASEDGDKLLLHISVDKDGTQVALCGEDASRNIISESLLSGLDVTVICAKCLALRSGGSGKQYVN